MTMNDSAYPNGRESEASKYSVDIVNFRLIVNLCAIAQLLRQEQAPNAELNGVRSAGAPK